MTFDFSNADQREAAMAAKWAEAEETIAKLRQQLAEANHAHEFMSQQYLDAIKERNQLRKDVAKLQEALHCKLTWKPS